MSIIVNASSLDLFIILLSLYLPMVGQCSVFTYTIHPPTPLDCNPFSNDPTPLWRLRTQCSVVASTTDIDQYEIHWIHRFSNGTIKDMGTLQNPGFNVNVPRADSFYGDKNDGLRFNEDMLGQYWCQVFSPAGNPMPLSAYSNELTIVRPEEYDIQLATCSGIRRDIGVSICNDLPPVAISLTTSQSNAPMTTSMPATTSAPVLVAMTSSNAITITESIDTPSGISPSITAISHITTLSTQSTVTVSPIDSTELMSTTAFVQSLVQSINSTTHLTQDPFISTPSSQNIPSTTHSSASQDSSNPSNDQTTVSPTTTTTTGTGIIPEERLNDEMSTLLITAIALIVVLSIIIILLLVIAYLMKCGRTPVAAQVHRRSTYKDH